MQFRPCIDIHNGKVKQIVGGSLRDAGDFAADNFVSQKGAEFYARLYKQYGLKGGHIIILNPPSSEFYKQDIEQAGSALSAYPDGLQIGGGINDENAGEFLSMGASHVIVTSFVFKDGQINSDNLQKLVKAVGKERIVIDLSCRRKQEDGEYYVVTDRWQKFTDIKLSPQTVEYFSAFCDEFLIHAVDAEGKAQGIEREVAKIMGKSCRLPATYAGGISSFEDLDALYKYGGGRLDFTVGSALDIFGGSLPFEKLAKLNEI